MQGRRRSVAPGTCFRPSNLWKMIPISKGEIILVLSTLLPSKMNLHILAVAPIPRQLLEFPAIPLILSNVESSYFSFHPFKKRKENSVCPTFFTYHCPFAPLFSKIPPMTCLYLLSHEPFYSLLNLLQRVSPRHFMKSVRSIPTVSKTGSSPFYLIYQLNPTFPSYN